MDTYNNLFKQHEKIRQQFRHDAIMRDIKKREDKLFRDMFIKVVLILVIFFLIVYILAE